MDAITRAAMSRPLSPADGVRMDAAHPRRAEVEAFIADVYRARFGAALGDFLPHLLAFEDEVGALRAAVGLQCGREGPLFVEQYLDAPAEAAIARATGRPVARSEIVEVGNFAALRPGDARGVILGMARRLHAAGFRWVLFTATGQLRNAFTRLHLHPVYLAEARAERLQRDATQWGRYYDTHPHVMFGDLVAGASAWAPAPVLRVQDPCGAAGMAYAEGFA